MREKRRQTCEARAPYRRRLDSDRAEERETDTHTLTKPNSGSSELRPQVTQCAERRERERERREMPEREG